MLSATITPEMIEDAAQAIRSQVGAKSLSPRGHTKPKPWEALPPALRDAYRAEALAALSAVICE